MARIPQQINFKEKRKTREEEGEREIVRGESVARKYSNYKFKKKKRLERHSNQ